MQEGRGVSGRCLKKGKRDALCVCRMAWKLVDPTGECPPKNKERCSFLARNQNCLKINVAAFRHKSLSLPASQRQSLKTNWTKLKSKT